jgi:hypothetical protein
MIVNSDERQWTWMDEGLNSFMEYMAEQELELIFLLVVGQLKHCSLHEWRSKILRAYNV